ncbi:MAG: zinc-binding dehydrogenase, partial [Alphaproteobacteria bacterium]|nr:zinc-binding dehydrogenase [Alphaproteobacteria bacterium]
MVKAIRIHEHGGPEKLVWEDVELGQPGQGEIRVKHHAVGLNYIDTYQRSGLYPLAQLPAVMGMEGAGEVIAVGAGVADFKAGDRVAYANPMGSYCEERNMPADRAVPVPEAIPYETAAAMMLQGMTVRYLLRETYKVTADTTLLFHAAAGGVGLAAIQLAQLVGATVIATEARPDKLDYLRSIGVEHVVDGRTPDFVDEVKQRSGGGVEIVLNFLPGEYIPASLAVLREGGRFIEIGKRGIWTPEHVARERADVTYFVVALDQITEDEPAQIGEMLREMLASFAAGVLQPLPLKTFPI